MKHYSLWIPSFRINLPISYLNRCFPCARGYFYFKNIFIYACAFEAMSYCTNQFLADILISGTQVVTVLKQTKKQTNKTITETKSICITALWHQSYISFCGVKIELIKLQRTPSFSLCNGIPYAFIISMRCPLRCQQLLLMTRISLLFLKSVSVL